MCAYTITTRLFVYGGMSRRSFKCTCLCNAVRCVCMRAYTITTHVCAWWNMHVLIVEHVWYACVCVCTRKRVRGLLGAYLCVTWYSS